MIDIRNFVNTAIGNTETHDIKSEEEITLGEGEALKSFSGKLELTNLEDEVLARFLLNVVVELACDRCLGKFESEKDIKFAREYTFSKEEDKIGIGRDFKIDISEPIREEAIMSLPLKRLCREDCGGNESTRLR